jgi:hypothetical protein
LRRVCPNRTALSARKNENYHRHYDFMSMARLCMRAAVEIWLAFAAIIFYGIV